MQAHGGRSYTLWAGLSRESFVLLVFFGITASASSCPSRAVAEESFFANNGTNLMQLCGPCLPGFECVDVSCTGCTPCQPGYFKDTASDSPCIACPKDTYNPQFASTKSTACQPCQRNTGTAFIGEISITACTCDNTTYGVPLENGSLHCRRCPSGATCKDGSCALRLQSQTCADGTQLLGTWERNYDNATGMFSAFVLHACPVGYAMMNSLHSSSASFDHNVQGCVECRARIEYLSNSSTGPCMPCPRGLRCHGGERFEPLMHGSEWRMEGNIFRLKSCPRGHRVWGGGGDVFDQEAQECLECPPGEHCPDKKCSECTACPVGTFKASISARLCTQCPLHHFSSMPGATAVSQCVPCPQNSYTTAAGAYNGSQCTCFESLYPVIAPGRRPVCSTCPAGALCHMAENRECALNNPTLSCPGTGPIQGSWSRDAEGYFVLRHCPRGTMLINSTNGTSSGTFARTIQQCKPCATCSDDVGGSDAWCLSAEYNAEPDKFQCQPCPEGAECNGDRWRTVGSLDLLGARWEVGTDGRLCLLNCPVGYRMRNDTGYERQRCERCAIGEYIFRSDDPSLECLPCPIGALCVNGAPPAFAVAPLESSIRIGVVDEGTKVFDDQLRTTLVKALEHAAGFPPGTIEITQACFNPGPSFCIDFFNPSTAEASTQTGVKLLHRRDELGFRGRLETARKHRSVQGAASRKLQQATDPSWLVDFRALVPGVNTSALVEIVSQPDFACGVAVAMGQIQPAYAELEMSIPANSTTEGALPTWGGEVYELQPDGRAVLVWCGDGQLLVNETWELQQCAACPPSTYSLHPLDHCTTLAADGHCSLRRCTQCPRGAFCPGNSHFEPAPGSQWEVVHDLEAQVHEWRLRQCPSGTVLVRLANASQDRCVPCPVGSYAFETAEYGNEWMHVGGDVDNPVSMVGDLLCLQCPEGVALCLGETRVQPAEGFWRGQGMICEISKCDHETHLCSPYYCRAYPGSQQLGTGPDGDLWRLRAMIYQCRPGHCVQNLASTTFSLVESDNVTLTRHRWNITVNKCREGHEGPLCGVCMRGWAKSGRNCARCDGSFDKYRDVLLAIMNLFVIIMTYAAAWRPLTYEWEDVVKKWIKSKKSRNRDEHHPLRRQIHGWLHESLSEILKIYISFLQVSGGFMTQVSVAWPTVLENSFAVATSIVQIDVFTLPGLSCALRDIKYKQKLMIMTAMPLAMIVFLALPSMLALVKFRHKIEACKGQFYYSALFFLFITYPSTSTVALQGLVCYDLGIDGEWLRSDPSVYCPAKDPDQLTFWWALLSSFIYPLGIPVLLWYLLILHGVPATVKAKQERSYLLAMLEHFVVQNSIPQKITEELLKDEKTTDMEASKQHREIVEISVIGAKHLPKMDVFGTIDPYVVLCLEDEMKRTQVVFDSNYEPFWGMDDDKNILHEDPLNPLHDTIGPDHPEYMNTEPCGEKFMFPLYDGVTQDLEVRCMDWDFGALNPADEVGTGWVTNEELRQLKPEDGKVQRKVVLELDGKAVRNGADGQGQDAFVLLKLRKVAPEEMQEELDRMTRLRKLMAFIGINYGDQVGQLSTKEQNDKIKQLYALRREAANSKDLDADNLKNKKLWADLEKEWQADNKDKEQGEKDEKLKSKTAGLSLVKELEPEQVHKIKDTIERKLKKIANANKKKKESQGEHVKAMLERVLGKDVEQYMEYEVREFRQVLEEMGQQDIGHSVIKGMIDRYGRDNKIDNPKIHAMVQKVILVREYLKGSEEPDNLDKRQLSELIDSTKFRRRLFNPSDAAHHQGKEPPQERMRKAQEERELERKDNERKMHDREHDLMYAKKEELREVLLSRVKEMETRGELVIPEAQWVGATRQERHAINRVGFLIYSYRCKYWWYEIADMLRKLLMIAVAVFGFDGTVSQIALGFSISVVSLCLTLQHQPFRNRALAVTHSFSLSVQSVTFFYGMILATGELNELAGEEGSQQRYVMGGIVTILNFILILVPIFDLCIAIMPGRYFLRQLLVQYCGLSKGAVDQGGGIKEEAQDLDMIKAKEIDEIKPHAQARFHLLALKTFLRERREKTSTANEADPNKAEGPILGCFPPNADLVFCDDATEGGALARSVDPDASEIEEEEAGVQLREPGSARERKVSFNMPIRLAMRTTADGVKFMQDEAAFRQKLEAEMLKMQAAFQAATGRPGGSRPRPLVKKQIGAASAYLLRSPEEEAAAAAAPEHGGQSFSLKQPGPAVESPTAKSRDLGDEGQTLELRVDRVTQAKNAKSLGAKIRDKTFLKKKKTPLWPAFDESDDEDAEKEKEKDRSALVEAELVVGQGKTEPSPGSAPGPGSSAASVTSARSGGVPPRPSASTSRFKFSRINVPLPHMHHHELFSHDKNDTNEVTEESIAIGNRTLAPDEIQRKYHAPGLLVKENSNHGDGKVKDIHTSIASQRDAFAAVAHRISLKKKQTPLWPEGSLGRIRRGR